LVLAALPLAVAQSDEQSTSQRQTARMFGAIWCRALYLYSYTPGIPSSSLSRSGFRGVCSGATSRSPLYCRNDDSVQKERTGRGDNTGGDDFVGYRNHLSCQNGGHVGNYGELTNTMKDVAVARSSFAWQQVPHRGARPRSSLLPS